MPTANEFRKSQLVKMMLVGSSGSGKTGALVSLLRAGYRIRMLDFDQGFESLIAQAEAESVPLDNFDFMTFRDKMKATTSGIVPDGPPRAFSSAMKALDKWEDGSTPSTWGDETFLVLDSLTNAGRAALQWAKAMDPTNRDPRRWYMTAQGLIEDLVSNLTGEEFSTNLLILTHIEITENKDGSIKHYASSIGKALGPKLPRFLNSMMLLESKVRGGKAERTLHTVPTAMLDLKVPGAQRFEKSYPISSGLADVVKILRGRDHPAT